MGVRKKLKPHKMIIKCIQSGGATKESIIKEAGLKDERALAAQFKVLREYFDLYPIEQEDNTFIILDEDAYLRHEQTVQARKDAALAKRKEKIELKKLIEQDPQKKLDTAIRRRELTLDRLDSATLRLAKAPKDQLLELKRDRAAIDFRIAELELNTIRENLCRFYKLSDAAELEDLRALGILNEHANKILGNGVNGSSTN